MIYTNEMTITDIWVRLGNQGKILACLNWTMSWALLQYKKILREYYYGVCHFRFVNIYFFVSCTCTLVTSLARFFTALKLGQVVWKIPTIWPRSRLVWRHCFDPYIWPIISWISSKQDNLGPFCSHFSIFKFLMGVMVTLSDDICSLKS